MGKTSADVNAELRASQAVQAARGLDLQAGNALLKYLELQITPLRAQLEVINTRLTALEGKRRFWPTRTEKTREAKNV